MQWASIPIFKECWFVSKKQQPQPTNKHTKPPHTLVKTAIKRVSKRCGWTLPCRQYSPTQSSHRKDCKALLKQREESCSQDILGKHTPPLLLQSMPCCSGRVASVLHECSSMLPVLLYLSQACSATAWGCLFLFPFTSQTNTCIFLTLYRLLLDHLALSI